MSLIAPAGTDGELRQAFEVVYSDWKFGEMLQYSESWWETFRGPWTMLCRRLADALQHNPNVVFDRVFFETVVPFTTRYTSREGEADRRANVAWAIVRDLLDRSNPKTNIDDPMGARVPSIDDEGSPSEGEEEDDEEGEGNVGNTDESVPKRRSSDRISVKRSRRSPINDDYDDEDVIEQELARPSHNSIVFETTDEWFEPKCPRCSEMDLICVVPRMVETAGKGRHRPSSKKCQICYALHVKCLPKVPLKVETKSKVKGKAKASAFVLVPGKTKTPSPRSGGKRKREVEAGSSSIAVVSSSKALSSRASSLSSSVPKYLASMPPPTTSSQYSFPRSSAQPSRQPSFSSENIMVAPPLVPGQKNILDAIDDKIEALNDSFMQQIREIRRDIKAARREGWSA